MASRILATEPSPFPVNESVPETMSRRRAGFFMKLQGMLARRQISAGAFALIHVWDRFAREVTYTPGQVLNDERRMAMEAGIDRKTYRKRRRELEKAGLIAVSKTGTKYAHVEPLRIEIPALCVFFEENRAKKSPGERAENSPGNRGKNSPGARGKNSPVHYWDASALNPPGESKVNDEPHGALESAHEGTEQRGKPRGERIGMASAESGRVSRPGEERATLGRLRSLFGDAEMDRWGGRWRTAIRKDAGAMHRVIADWEEMVRDGRAKAIRNGPGYVWKLLKDVYGFES